MSGGVDSSLSAHLLVEKGYDVTGVFMECWRAPGCRTDQDRKDALTVALDLGIGFTVLDFKDAYHARVVEYFFAEYAAGRTPNPDVMCNREIKFGLFYDWAMNNGFDYIATGHYAKIVDSKLFIPKDTHKDQTYFLYPLTSEQLSKTIFPLGDITKREVRSAAQERGLAVATKKDSVGICFIGDINVHSFLKERLGENPGEVIDVYGNVIGKHQGLWFYTIGQRHGFQIDAKTVVQNNSGTYIDRHNIPPFYVVEKLPEKNQLVVGFGSETEKQTVTVDNFHWIDESLVNNVNDQELLLRIRHTGDLHPCKVSGTTFTLQQPISGIARGQSAVLYARNGSETICLGGGVII